MAVCPACQRENPDEARFCLSCGKSLTGDEPAAPSGPSDQTIASQPGSSALALEKPGVSPASRPAGARRLNWRCCGAGCLVALLLVLIGLPLLHVTVVRPFFHTELTRQAMRIADESFDVEKYSGMARMATFTQSEVNTQATAFWQRTPGASNGRISLAQDLMAVDVTIYGLPLHAEADLRVNVGGEFVLRSFTMNWAMHLFFTEKDFQDILLNYLNEEILLRGNRHLRAFQVTDGQLFLMYEMR